MKQPELKFHHELDDRAAFEAGSKGHLGPVTVVLDDNSEHKVYFYDPIRLPQDLEAGNKLGRPFLAEKGLIIISRITIENMVVAVAYLEKPSFFA